MPRFKTYISRKKYTQPHSDRVYKTPHRTTSGKEMNHVYSSVCEHLLAHDHVFGNGTCCLCEPGEGVLLCAEGVNEPYLERE